MANTTTVRISVKSSVAANVLLARVNKARKKEKKEELSKSQLIALAINDFKLESGVNYETL